MDVYIKEGRVYGLLKNRKILKLTLDNQTSWQRTANWLNLERDSDKMKRNAIMT